MKGETTMSNEFDSAQRNTIWNNYFGNVSSGTDVYGRSVAKSNFEADHIYPRAKGGKTVVTNGMPLNPTSNAEKSDDMSGTVNGKHFQVQGTTENGKVNVNGTSYGYRG